MLCKKLNHKILKIQLNLFNSGTLLTNISRHLEILIIVYKLDEDLIQLNPHFLFAKNSFKATTSKTKKQK